MRTHIREVFAAAASAYSRGNPLLTIEREETPALLPELAGRDVLDLGAGHGYYAALARARDARCAIALDLTPEMLAEAARPAVLADAAALPLQGESVDVVVAAMVLSLVPDRPAALAEAARVLRPGGALVVSDLHPVAAERGWRRTFEGGDGRTLSVEAAPLSTVEVESGLQAAGLIAETRREVRIDERLLPEFRRAGRTDFETLFGTPLLQIFRACKPRHHPNGGSDAR